MRTLAPRQRQRRKHVASGPARPQTGASAAHPADVFVALQRTIGNQAVQRLLQPQPGQPDQPAVPPSMHEVVASAGQPLDAATRAFMEPGFGQDFSQVRVHTDTRAAESAAAVGARAYTVGQHVVLGEGHPSPDTVAGRQVLAHELAHVVQQRRGGPAPELTPSAAHERDADAIGMAVAAGESNVPVSCHTGVGLARQQPGEWETIRATLRGVERVLQDWRLLAEGLIAGQPIELGRSGQNLVWTPRARAGIDYEFERPTGWAWEWRLRRGTTGREAVERQWPPRLADTRVALEEIAGEPDVHGQDRAREAAQRLRELDNLQQQLRYLNDDLERAQRPAPAEGGGPGPKAGGPGAAGAGAQPVGEAPASGGTGALFEEPPPTKPPGGTFEPPSTAAKPVLEAPPPTTGRPGLGSAAVRGLSSPTVMGALSAIGMGAEYLATGQVNFGALASEPGNPNLVLGEGGFGLVRRSSRDVPLPPDMKTLSPEEAERTLQEGDHFIKRSAATEHPAWEKAPSWRPFLTAQLGEVELWRIKYGYAVPTGCTSNDGQVFEGPANQRGPLGMEPFM